MTTTLQNFLPIIGLVCSTPAWAKSKCEAMKPDAHVSTEETSKVDAQVSARIASLGSGGAQAGLANSTAYDTVLLTQDQYARSYLLYQLCVAEERKLITRDEYQAELRLINGQAPAPTPEPSPTPMPSSPPISLVGTWVVTTRTTRSTCDGEKPGSTTHYSWAINDSPAGGYAIAATWIDQGAEKTQWPSLTGGMSDGLLTLSGGSALYMLAKAVDPVLGDRRNGVALTNTTRIYLHLDGDRLVGERLVASTGKTREEPAFPDIAGSDDVNDVYRSCATEAEVVAVRQP